MIAPVEDSFLTENGVEKGIMQLIEQDRAETLYDAMKKRVQTPGGSVANTIAGAGALGLSTAFIGRVHDDALGHFYADAMNEGGTDFVNPPVKNGELPTSRSMIFVSPDGERSMNTYLGACVELGPEDVDAAIVAASKVTYFEGYLWDPPRAKEAIRNCAAIAHEHGREVSMTLSDPFCVDRYREEFLELMRSGTVDIVFSNEHEVMSLYQTASLETAVDALEADCKLAIITLGERGSIVARKGERVSVSAIEINELVDTTGAGDLYASGFLYGYTNGHTLESCARLGSLAAGLVIQQIGPRPNLSLRQAGIDSGLIKV